MDLCTYFIFLLNLDLDLNPAGACQMLDFVFSGAIQSVLCEAHTTIQETWVRWALLKDPEVIYIYLFPLLKDFLVKHFKMLNFMNFRIRNTITIKYKNSLFFLNLYGYQKFTLSKIAKKKKIISGKLHAWAQGQVFFFYISNNCSVLLLLFPCQKNPD